MNLVLYIIGDSQMFWVIVETVRILILKLGSSFWLLPNNVDNPAHLLSLITENELYLELFEKSSMADFGGVQVRVFFISLRIYSTWSHSGLQVVGKQ